MLEEIEEKGTKDVRVLQDLEVSQSHYFVKIVGFSVNNLASM